MKANIILFLALIFSVNILYAQPSSKEIKRTKTENITFDDGKEKIELTTTNGDVTELRIDGKNIDPSDFKKYQSSIDKARGNEMIAQEIIVNVDDSKKPQKQQIIIRKNSVDAPSEEMMDKKVIIKRNGVSEEDEKLIRELEELEGEMGDEKMIIIKEEKMMDDGEEVIIINETKDGKEIRKEIRKEIKIIRIEDSEEDSSRKKNKKSKKCDAKD